MFTKRQILHAAAIAVALFPAALWAGTGSGSNFTYQGQLKEADVPVKVACDMTFTLWDAATAGGQIGGTIAFDGQAGNQSPVEVANGLFAVELDFGTSVFDGADRWLEVAVRRPHDPTNAAAYTTLSPRQPFTAVPYASHALSSRQWTSSGSAIINSNPGFVGINRDYTVGSEWFGVHAPVNSGYGGMYVTTEGATGKPFYGYHTGTEKGWHYLDGSDGDWHLNLDGDRLTVTDEGNVGIGTTNPTHRLQVRSGGDKAIFGQALSSSAAAVGVHGTTASADGFAYGVKGEVTNQAGTGVGVYGEAPFYGVMGKALGGGVGVQGWSEGIGVYGEGTTGEGVLGVSRSTNPLIAGVTGHGEVRGVYGLALANSGEVAGVYGQSSSPNGAGLHGVNDSNGGFAYGVLGELTDPTSTGIGVYGRAQFYGVTGEATGNGVGVIGRSSLGVYGESSSAGGTGVMGASTAASGTTYGVYGTVNSSAGYAGYFAGRGHFELDLGIGIVSPAHRLHVYEDSTSSNVVHIERGADASSSSDLLELEMGDGSADATQFIECQRSGGDIEFRVWADGDVSADGIFTAGGADYAEMVKISSGAESVQAGDVMVIDPANPSAFLKSGSARSTLVAGVYSTKPGVLGSEHDWDQLAAELVPPSGEGQSEPAAVKSLELGRMIDEVPLAVIGIVPCKASAENGSITPGDLLVTSGTPGHAMRDDIPRAGTIVGKALGSLESGTGVIKVLVTLQ